VKEKKLFMSRGLISRKSKIIIGGIGAVVILAAGVVTYCISTSSSKESAKEQQVQDEGIKADNIAKKEEPVKEDTIKKEVTKSDTTNKDTKKNSTTTTQSNKQKTTSKITSDNAKSGAITYKSTKLGIAFDMPSSWAETYNITDDGRDVVIYIKDERNDTGYGTLITISKDISAHNNGDFMDTIGNEKVKNINGKEYIVGGPTGLSIDNNDPKYNIYMSMIEDRINVVKSIRGI
jgi:hypothetical protein